MYKKLLSILLILTIALSSAGCSAPQNLPGGGSDFSNELTNGSVYIVFGANDPTEATEEGLALIDNLVKARLSYLADEINTEVDLKNGCVKVSLLPNSELTEEEYSKIANDMCIRHEITFAEGDEENKGDVIITGDMIDNVNVVAVGDGYGLAYAANIELGEEATKIFAEVTGRLSKDYGNITVWADDEVISCATVQATITDGKLILSGNFTLESIGETVSKLLSGMIPFEFSVLELNVVSDEG